MAIPGFQSIMLPLLKVVSDEVEHNHAEVRDALAIQFDISNSEKKEMLPSGKQARFDNRVAWAIVYLRRAGLIENSSRGIFRITGQGLDLLKTNPDNIDIKLLKQLNPELLVAVKNHPLIEASYWKIAPGKNAWNWDACREGGFIAIGWDELGDVSMLSRSQFNARWNELLKEQPDWNKVGVEQVWKFVHIKKGDRIIANKGTSEVLGIGTVTGPYYFVEGVRHGHRIPVEWDDCTPRKIDRPGWKKTLIELTQEKFDEIYKLSDSIDIYKIFKDRDEAKWAFDLLEETLNRLGINGPNDERFAITCPSGGKALHLDFGQWMVLGFSNLDVGPDRIEIALLADQTKFYSQTAHPAASCGACKALF